MSYASDLSDSHPPYFWAAYAVLAFVFLGSISHVYDPIEDYYLGWQAGPLLMDDPLTTRDDVDRAHFALGCAVALPRLLVDSYLSIARSTWLWRPLKEREIAAAVELLQALAASDVDQAERCLRTLPPPSGVRVLWALVELGMIAVDRGRPRLQAKGRELLGAIAGR